MLEIQQGKEEEDEEEEEEGSTTQHKVVTKSLEFRQRAQTKPTPSSQTDQMFFAPAPNSDQNPKYEIDYYDLNILYGHMNLWI